MNEELLSIIVPIYKVEKYIHQCIDSIINQTYKNIEIILVDDGSPDSCGSICEEYAKKDVRVKVIHKRNGGLSDARNEGLKIAKGKYIGFVDSDDYIKEDMYEYLYNLIIENQAEISTCGFFLKYENEEKIVESKNNPKSKILCNNKEGIRRLLVQNKVQNYAWNKLYKKSLFDDIEYPKGKKMEDLGTTYKLFSKAKKVVLGEEFKYIYRQRIDSITGTLDTKFLIDNFELAKERYDFINKKFPDLIENNLSIIETILNIYRVDDSELNKYIAKNRINKLYKKLLKKNVVNIITKAKFLVKIKIILYAINKKAYKKYKGNINKN